MLYRLSYTTVVGAEGLEPPKVLHRLVYSQEPLPLGYAPNVVAGAGIEPASTEFFKLSLYR